MVIQLGTGSQENTFHFILSLYFNISLFQYNNYIYIYITLIIIHTHTHIYIL